LLKLVDVLVDEPRIDEGEIQDGNELSTCVLENSVQESVAEAVRIGTINEVQCVAVGLDEVWYRSPILSSSNLRLHEGISQYVDSLFVQPTDHKQIPSCCCPDLCALALAQLGKCVRLEWIVGFAAEDKVVRCLQHFICHRQHTIV